MAASSEKKVAEGLPRELGPALEVAEQQARDAEKQAVVGTMYDGWLILALAALVVCTIIATAAAAGEPTVRWTEARSATIAISGGVAVVLFFLLVGSMACASGGLERAKRAIALYKADEKSPAAVMRFVRHLLSPEASVASGDGVGPGDLIAAANGIMTDGNADWVEHAELKSFQRSLLRGKFSEDTLHWLFMAVARYCRLGVLLWLKKVGILTRDNVNYTPDIVVGGGFRSILHEAAHAVAAGKHHAKDVFIVLKDLGANLRATDPTGKTSYRILTEDQKEEIAVLEQALREDGMI